MSNVSSDIFVVDEGILCVALSGLFCDEGDLIKDEYFSFCSLGVPVAARFHGAARQR